MSAAYKCDRCGTFYSNFDHPKLNDIRVEKIAYGLSDPYRGQSNALDLCQRCAEEFITWWKLGEA